MDKYFRLKKCAKFYKWVVEVITDEKNKQSLQDSNETSP